MKKETGESLISESTATTLTLSTSTNGSLSSDF